jgi:protein TonB
VVRDSGGAPWFDSSPPRRSPRPQLIGLLVAVGLHAGVWAMLVTVHPSRWMSSDKTVEMEVVEPPPPPPAVAEPGPPPAAPPPRAPRAIPRPVTVAPTVTPPPETPTAPPPPNQESPPNTPPAPPVFGVTMSSVVPGESKMAVPVGNTVATNDRSPPRPGAPVLPLTGAGAPSFVPVADIYIAQQARIVYEVNSADIYPSDAKRMGIEGTVDLRVGIDQNGDVKEVKVIKVKPAGYKFDDAALEAARRAKFSPARTSDGKAVPANITWHYTFALPQ